jgi:transmembrane sensor
MPPEEILEEAANWVARLNADDRSREDEERFQAWIAADPEHGVAFEVMDRGWSAIAGIQRRAEPQGHHVSRRQLVMAALGGSVVVGTSFFVLRPATAQTYETAVGEQKHLALKDGSKILMNASTKLVISVTDALRSADLVYGRANFDIAKDGTRPFIVSAGQRQIVSQGSRFDVGLDGSDVQVVLTQGTAYFHDVTAASSPKKSLGAGDRLLASGASVRIDRPRIEPLVAWQTRTAIFDDTVLSEAVREMNLYSQTKLEIVDGRAAQLHVSGIYRVGDNAAFARSIAKFLPVQVSQQGDRMILRSSGSNG